MRWTRPPATQSTSRNPTRSCGNVMAGFAPHEKRTGASDPPLPVPVPGIAGLDARVPSPAPATASHELHASESIDAVLATHGDTLPANVRRRMERRFAH